MYVQALPPIFMRSPVGTRRAVSATKSLHFNNILSSPFEHGTPRALIKYRIFREGFRFASVPLHSDRTRCQPTRNMESCSSRESCDCAAKVGTRRAVSAPSQCNSTTYILAPLRTRHAVSLPCRGYKNKRGRTAKCTKVRNFSDFLRLCMGKTMYQISQLFVPPLPERMLKRGFRLGRRL